MAIQNYSPTCYRRVPADLEELKAIRELLAESGHPVPDSTLRGWIKQHGLYSEKRGKKVYLSWSQVLPVHRDFVARRQGR